jgi:hypothetical protein
MDFEQTGLKQGQNRTKHGQNKDGLKTNIFLVLWTLNNFGI